MKSWVQHSLKILIPPPICSQAGAWRDENEEGVSDPTPLSSTRRGKLCSGMGWVLPVISASLHWCWTRRENSGIRGNFSYSLAILEEVLLQLRLTSHADISGLCVSSSPSQLPDMGPPLPNATAWKLKTCTMTSVTSKLCNLPYPQVNSWLRHFLLQDASKQYKGTKVQSNNSMFGTDVQKSKINTSICLPVKFFTELFTYLNVVCLFTSITDLHPRF